jgi:hypothetical protein
MLPLFEMLANAQNGNGMEALARQFGISQAQAQAAVEALMPAFSQGFRRSTADPYGVGAFLSALSTGQHAKYFEDAGAAFSPQGMAEGNGILGHLFGSKELSRAVAGQAAQATGLSQDLLKQMLPAIAAMLMGGLFKQSNSQLQAGGFGQASGTGGNPLGDIIEQMMRQGGMAGGEPPSPRQGQQPDAMADNPFGKILEGMFGGGQQRSPQDPQNPMGGNPWGKMLEDLMRGGESARQQRPTPDPRSQNPTGNPMGGDNPLGKIFEEMMRGGQARQQQPSAPEPEPGQPRANPSGRARNPYDDLFGRMFETGAKQRDDYQKGVEDIFDRFSKGLDRYR